MSVQLLRGVLRLASKNENFRQRMIARLRKRLAFTLLPVGKTLFNAKSNLRFHRYADHFEVMDMTNAGKRGKRVPIFALMYGQHWDDPGIEAVLSGLISEIMSSANYGTALRTAKEMVNNVQSGFGYPGGHYSPGQGPKEEVTDLFLHGAHTFLRLEEWDKRGVDVTPMGNKIELDAPKFTLESTPTEFSIRDKVDRNNMPAAIPAMKAGRTQAAAFFKWLRTTDGALAKLEKMDFGGVLDTIKQVTGRYPHTWSMMD